MCNRFTSPATKSPNTTTTTTTTTTIITTTIVPVTIFRFVAKYKLQDGTESNEDCFADNEGDESDTDTSDNDNDSSDSGEEVYTWPFKVSSFELATWYGPLQINSGKW